MDRIPDAQKRKCCRGTKGKDERVDEGVQRWFSHVERRENDRIAKRVYVGESAGSG